jgi:molybdopterin converting factor small subunit
MIGDYTGKSEEVLSSKSTTPKELYTELQEIYAFKHCPSNLKVAVNDEFSDWDTNLKDGDIIVFIPPVAGG